MAKRISELYEHELIELAESNMHKDQIAKEWFSRWGLEFPLIRTAFGIKQYGDTFTKSSESNNNVAIHL